MSPITTGNDRLVANHLLENVKLHREARTPHPELGEVPKLTNPISDYYTMQHQ